jgi:hypothetical protein
MFSLCKNFININGDLFQVKRTFTEEWMNGKDLDLLKTWYGVDVVFKKDMLLYFCIKINELEIVN